jgi:hypothetical protein
MWQHQGMKYLSLEQGTEVRSWLEENGFTKNTGGTIEPELWSHDHCDVQIRSRGRHVRILIRHGKSGYGWRNLDEVGLSRRTWPEYVTTSPIQLATLPTRVAEAEHPSWRDAPGEWLYRKSTGWAHGVKVALQMVVGIVAVVDIGMHFVHSISTETNWAPIAPDVAISVQIIADALAAAAAIELAYTLYTPGPDEALDPLMLGLSSGLLLLITTSGISAVTQYGGVLLGVAALGGLFIIRRYLIGDDE